MGPLYKCSICGEFVYQSQLDHHVSVCPDPQVATLGHPDQVPTDTVPNNEVLVDTLASEATQRMWKQWKDSDLAAHHDAMVQRKSMKRSQLLDELRKKEEEECTFQPKTLPFGSPRTISRQDHTGEGKWREGFDRNMRNQRLRQVEAQHYAELTLKPKISPYAQAWSQKQTEVASDSQVPYFSVFERLYQAALVQEEKRIAAIQQRQATDQGDIVGSVTNSSFRQPPSRRVPTSELLYSDALDRRERLRIMTEQLQIRRDEESKEKRAVLNRSRRYYWQMLERQIKAAFEEATDGGPLLTQSSLEEFLIEFKCMRPRRGDQSVTEDSESSRLQLALWRHLDPNKVGHTDLLTLTVFFHVLMGAVDEAAQGASGSLATSAAMEEAGMSPGRSSPGRGSPRSNEGSGALQSISEEERLEAADALLGRSSSHPAAQDDDGRRIVELLLRFDPVRLRTEFQPLYSHRMHYQSQQEKKLPSKEEEPSVVPPSIDSQSRILANRLLQRQKGESGKATHADILLWRHSQVEAKKEDKRAQRKNDEVSSCTFKPKCNKLRSNENNVEVCTPAGATRAQVLYARGLAERERREAKVLEGEKARQGAEIRDCTFQPNTHKSSRSYHRAHDSPATVPRGFYESRQRLRAAQQVREQTVAQREDRLAKITPTSPATRVSAGLGAAAGVGTSVSSSALEARSRRGGGESCSSPGLSTVREERRRSVSPKISCWNGKRQNSAAPATARTPRRGDPAAAERGASQPPPASASGYPEDPAGAGALPAPTASSGVEAPAAAPEEKPAVLFVDVNIAPGQPPERIILREGQSVSEVAAEFAAKHVLTPVLAARLHALLREVVERQELSQPQ
eukprot:TRINITY_DN518_c0_g1_i2.p1 TRINITY_DN518_c0_g1~~TRINITY_DN518_c0_g1_i2.p1  ORF type:complete len:946 (+),score=219.67 TRINITY_DN518_c0_g1_i2:280-2838(+)